jgi:hypothetical protein
MKKAKGFALLVSIFLLFAAIHCQKSEELSSEMVPVKKWKIHDKDRPLPLMVDPGPLVLPIPPPSDAEVLFEGKDLSQWEDSRGNEAQWKVKNGYMEVAEKKGSIQTKKGFGSCQLHIEWAAPSELSGDGQARGNSGVFLMGYYEVQILDNYENKTYADGMAGAVYGQYPPLVNVCRPPGEWQCFDIIFVAPQFDEKGKLQKPARLTVFHNHVLIHHDVALTGPTAWKMRPSYKTHPEKLPLSLQDHGDPVRFRNIWIREISTDKN